MIPYSYGRLAVSKLNAGTPESHLETLLQKFQQVRWSGPFDLHDVSALAHMHPRVSGEVVNLGLVSGQFARDRAGYRLTPFATAADRQTGVGTNNRERAGPRHISRAASPDQNQDGDQEPRENSVSRNTTFSNKSPTLADSRKSTGASFFRTASYAVSVTNEVSNTNQSRSLTTNRVSSIPSARVPGRVRSTPRANTRRAKEVFRGEVPQPSDPPEIRVKALALAREYLHQLQEYKRNRFLQLPQGWLKKQGRTWQRAVSHAEKCCVDFETYVKAQFWFFHTVAGRAPRAPEMASYRTQYNSVWRVYAYLEAKAKGDMSINADISSRVLKVPKITNEQRFAHCLRTLQSLMKNHRKTEEEILRVYAKGAYAALYFDFDWLNQQPTYQRLREAGQV